MRDISIYHGSGLPVKTEELAKFILIAPEKVKALKAEIRAIEKAQLAEAVRQQKREELSRLCGLIVLADARMGEITREMPTSRGKRTDRELVPAGGNRFEKPKKQAIQDLGLSTSQVSRMEQMAAHPDIVEEVIAESQAGQTEATQGEVFRRIKERENRVIDLGEYWESKCQADMARIDNDFKNLKIFRKMMAFNGLDEITDEILESVVAADVDLSHTLQELEQIIQRLTIIKAKLAERRKQRGKKDFHAGH